jgi:hypothetical protein
MGSGIVIARLDLTASGLRASAKRTREVSASRRMLCLAMVLDGSDRKPAAWIVRPCGTGSNATMRRACAVSTT